MSSDKACIEQWVDTLSKEEMPVFGVTAGKLASMASDSNSSVVELSKVILSDPAMTAKVLRMANSVYHNPQQQKINTISRAVVLLGFDTVHAICLSVSIVDTLLKGAPRTRLLQEVTQSIHAAIQAKNLVQMLGSGSGEEVFIAALLYHLGDMAFWCFGEEQADQLDSDMMQSVDSAEDLTKNSLGFTFKELTTSLVKQWKLGDSVLTVLSDEMNKPAWTGCVELGHELAMNIGKGWHDHSVNITIGKIAKHIHMAKHQVEKIVQGNAAEAVRQARMYKINDVEQFIPVTDALDDNEEPPIDAEQEAAVEPDELLQLNILRELSLISSTKADLNMVLQMILEGLHRGVGLDRVCVAILSADKKTIRSKYVLSSVTTDLDAVFSFRLNENDARVFVTILTKMEYAWVGSPRYGMLNKLLTNVLVKALQTKHFYIAPVIIGTKSIGVFYADRQPSKRPLDESSFLGFQHFTRQANMALSMLAKQ